MKQLASINLTTRTATDWTPPVLTYGESLTLALRFYKNDAGSVIDVPLTVNSLKAAIGFTDSRPTGGAFALKIGNAPADSTNTTNFIDFNAPASVLAARCNAVSSTAAYGSARVISTNGSWLLFFGDQSQEVPLEVVNNGLWPLSLGNVSSWQVDGKWVHELRLTQAPVAFTSTSSVVLPPAPVITRLQAGATTEGVTTNELQQIYVPPDFLGAYVIKRGYATTTQLSIDDGPDLIQAALQVFGAGEFNVTLPLSNKPTIEFVGALSGAAQDLLAAEVVQAPPGDLTFTLPLNRAELASALRGSPQINMPLQILINATDESGFTDTMVALTLPVTIQAPVITAEMEEVPSIDWMRPASPRTYTPFGSGEILTGNKYWTTAQGDGETSIFVLTHGLDTDEVFVIVRENISGGKLLVNGTDWKATLDSANQVTVTALSAAPAANAWAVSVVGAATVAAWANDLTVTAQQVVAGGGYPALVDFMNSTGERLTVLEAILPQTGPGASSTSGANWSVMLPLLQACLFFRGDATKLFTESGVDLTQLPPNKPPFMLPAVHASSTTDLPDTLPAPSAHAGTVYLNAGDAAVLLPGGSGIRSANVQPSGFAACDGRLIYPARKDGTTKSYFASAFEQELFRLAINDRMFPVGTTFDVEFGLILQLINADCAAQWLLRIWFGSFETDTTPSTTAPNLKDILWADTPALEQAIVLTPLPEQHSFGIRVQRNAPTDALPSGLTCDKKLYSVWIGNNAAAPASANFAVRAMLQCFDTEDNDPTSRGWVSYQLIGSSSADSSGNVSTSPAQANITAG